MMQFIQRKKIYYLLIILISLCVVFVANEYYELKQPGIIVLLYHKIHKKTDGSNKYVLSLNKFKEQMSYLRENNYTTIIPNEIKGLSNINGKKIMLSFDDSTEDHFHEVYNILKDNKQKGIFFVITKYINSQENLTEKQIRIMSQDHMEIGSHTYTHPCLQEINKDEIYYQLNKSKEQLEKIIGNKVISFAPPGGWFNDNALSIAEDLGYKAFFTCEIGLNDLKKKPFIYKRIEVLGDMTLEDFKSLLNPPDIIFYKLEQTIKFILHDLIGDRNYKKLAEILY